MSRGILTEKKDRLRYVPCGSHQGKYFEAVRVDGRPYFLGYDGKNIIIRGEIVVSENEKYRDLHMPESNISHEPYNFTGEEVQSITKLQREISPAKAYGELLGLIGEFLDVEDDYRHILVAGIMLCYQQHKSTTVPYLIAVGDRESGKSRMCDLWNYLAYRPLYSPSLPSADIYNYLGSDVEARGTIIEDELESLSPYSDKLKLYKAGYRKGSVVPRVKGENKDKLIYYKAFCLKVFAGEKLPESASFLDRCIIMHFVRGYPKKDVIEEEDIERFRKARKGLLVWRLLTASDPLPKIETGFNGRSREVNEPLLRVVHELPYYRIVLDALTKLDVKKRSQVLESIEGYIARAILALCEGNDSNGQPIPFDTIWNGLAEQTGAEIDQKGMLKSDVFARPISKRFLGLRIQQAFKGSKKRERFDGKVQVVYSFEHRVLKAMQRKYIWPVTVVTVVTDKTRSEVSSSRSDHEGADKGSGHADTLYIGNIGNNDNVGAERSSPASPAGLSADFDGPHGLETQGRCPADSESAKRDTQTRKSDNGELKTVEIGNDSIISSKNYTNLTSGFKVINGRGLTLEVVRVSGNQLVCRCSGCGTVNPTPVPATEAALREWFDRHASMYKDHDGGKE